MNHLNSVILEGVVSTGFDENGLFTVASSRYKKVGEDLVEEKTFVKCCEFGVVRKYAENKLNKGRGIRIVGYLKNIEGGVGLFVEHIEFKPDTSKLKEGKYTFTKEN